MDAVRVLVGDGSYDWPDGPWLRVNMIATVDGSAQGADGRSGTINNAVDKEYFHLLRRTADLIVVGAGTARAENYRPAATPIAVVSGSGGTPPLLEGSARVLRGGSADELRTMVAALYDEGFEHIVCEGGPKLLRGLLAAGVVDELCTTTVPLAIGGPGVRMVDGPPIDVPLRLVSLLECDGTLLARWVVSPPLHEPDGPSH